MAENQTDQSNQRPKKKTSWPKVMLIILALVLVLCVLKLFLLLTARPTISVDYAAEFNRIFRPADYDPNQNAAVYYQKAFDEFVPMPDIINNLWKTRSADMNDYDIELVENWINSNTQTLDYLDQALQKPYYWVRTKPGGNGLTSVDFSHLAKFRRLAYCLKYRSKVMSARGQFAEALETVMILKNMSAHLSQSKVLVAQVLATAVDGLAVQTAFEILDSTDVDSETLYAFQSRLEQAPRQQNLFSLDGELLLDYDAIQRLFTDDGNGNGHFLPHKFFKYHGYAKSLLGHYSSKHSKHGAYLNIAGIYLKIVWASLGQPDRRRTTKFLEQTHKLLGEIIKVTPWQMHQQSTSYDQQLQRLVRGNYLLNIWFKGKGRICQIYHRRNASQNALITTIAVLRYKADKGCLPENLDQLVSAGYLKELPVEPFGPGTLTYKPAGDDFTLYSFGCDFDDDGGIGYKWGTGKEGGDQVFWPIKRPEKNQKLKTKN